MALLQRKLQLLQTCLARFLFSPSLFSGARRRIEGDAATPPAKQQAQMQQRRKDSHNATEQKRRQRINDKMAELKVVQTNPSCLPDSLHQLGHGLPCREGRGE